MRPHSPEIDQCSPSSRTQNGYAASSSRKVWSVRVPGMRQRTSRPSECVSDMQTSLAAAHRRSGAAGERRRWRVRTANSGSQASSVA